MKIYDFSVKTMNNDMLSLEKFRGQVLLVINSATHCGFTPQYKGLQALHDKYHDKGFEILDFPCNQFMNQAPEDNEGIKSFCELNYQTKFPTFAKIDVNGKNQDPLFKYLKEAAPKEIGGGEKEQKGLKDLFFGNKIKWNFTKFLINRDGEIIARFSPGFEPENIVKYIDKII